MSDSKDKKTFAWEKGNVLDDTENFAPMGNVRVKGLPKMKKALHADPSLRKKERDQVIITEQSKPYHLAPRKNKENDKSIIIDESQSGLTDETYEDSKVKKLIDHGKKLRGVDRFGGKKK